MPPRPLRDLNTSYFPFSPVKDAAAWQSRREEIERRVLLASGLWPMPERTPLNAVIHGRIEREDYTVDKVFFMSLPDHFVTGNLYLPKNAKGKMPVVLCPHGHWPNGRFMNAGDAEVRKELATGAERFENGAHSPLQARCVQLARMGCAVFFYDMLGYADSLQFTEHRHGPQPQGFISADAEQNLYGYFNLQIWNGIRSLDFLLSLPNVDATRVGCTGASGGGTQTMILAGIDPRITAAFPCVMVSTAMQGGCTCENTNHLRINQGNIDIAALTAPRPLGMTAANDWTKELETKGFPDLKNLYQMLGRPNDVTALFATHFPHNYNHVARTAMYTFFNKHFKLGLVEPVLERDFTLSTKEELSVWDEKHPAPAGDKVGLPHEVAVGAWFKEQTAKALAPLQAPQQEADVLRAREKVGGAWEVLVGRALPAKGETSFDVGSKEERGDHFLIRGTAHYKASDHVDVTFLYPKNWNNKALLWLSSKGPESLVSSQGDLTEAGRKLVAEGYAVACPVPYLHDASRNPNVYARRKLQTYEGYAGYHYGYNPSIFAERVRDALTVIAMIRDHDKYHTDKIVVAGLEGQGPVAAATIAEARDVVGKGVIATAGFRFASLQNVWDLNFVPGAVKYGDVPALISQCAPVELVVHGETAATLPGPAMTYKIAKGSLAVAGIEGIEEDFALQAVTKR
ncbi:MAG: acetylxylan esterase [Verrucomicrobium sp.]